MRRFINSKGLVFGVALAVFTIADLAMAPLALAQNQDLYNRLNRLENEIETLNDAIFRGSGAADGSAMPRQVPSGSGMQLSRPENAGEMQVRLSELENQLQNLTGQIEEQGFQMNQLMGELESHRADSNLRFQDLEQTVSEMRMTLSERGPSSPGAAQRVEVTGGAPVGLNEATDLEKEGAAEAEPAIDNLPPQPNAVPQPVVADTPETPDMVEMEAEESAMQTLGQLNEEPSQAMQDYEDAFSRLRVGRYAEAAEAFRQFLNNHPGHALEANARYWLSETYYVRGDFEEAARGFAQGYRDYPGSAKQADNLLKLALSLSNLQQTDQACVTLLQLQRTVPDAPTPIRKRAEQERERLGC